MSSPFTAAPVPAQTPLPGDPRTIRFYRAASWREAGRCHGATAAGGCVQPLEDGSVPCAGCVMVLPVPVHGSVQWHIPKGYRDCFVGNYSRFCASG